MILVNEFLPRGSLDYHLFGGRGQSLLWERRLKIAVGAAGALAFLHSSERQAMYRCFNSCDILLDSEFNAKLSGYDLGIVSCIGSVKLGYEPQEFAATGYNWTCDSCRFYAIHNRTFFKLILDK